MIDRFVAYYLECPFLVRYVLTVIILIAGLTISGATIAFVLFLTDILGAWVLIPLMVDIVALIITIVIGD